MRRIILEEPWARTAVWSRGFALFAFAVALIGLVMARAGLDPTAAMAIEGAAIVIAAAAVLLALAAMVVIWRTGYRGTGRLLAGLFVAAVVLAYPAFTLFQANRIPSLSDVSTDLADPPHFATSREALALRGGVTPGEPTSAMQDIQRRLYPDIQPIVLDIEAMDAHALILKIVTARHWRITDDALPLGRFGVGRIDAVAKTMPMGFPADVTIRIKPLAGQARVDIRSVSRTPWQEPGSNAARIEALAADLDDQSSDEK